MAHHASDGQESASRSLSVASDGASTVAATKVLPFHVASMDSGLPVELAE
jgi:hypothetical protein